MGNLIIVVELLFILGVVVRGFIVNKSIERLEIKTQEVVDNQNLKDLNKLPEQTKKSRTRKSI